MYQRMLFSGSWLCTGGCTHAPTIISVVFSGVWDHKHVKRGQGALPYPWRSSSVTETFLNKGTSRVTGYKLWWPCKCYQNLQSTLKIIWNQPICSSIISEHNVPSHLSRKMNLKKETRATSSVGPDNTAAAKSLQSCPTLCNPIDGSPPGSPIPGILLARTLEWVAISFSNVWKWKVKSESEVDQSCPTLSDSTDCSLPGSSVHWIFQARVLEWGAIAFSTRQHRSHQTGACPQETKAQHPVAPASTSGH